MNSYSYDPFGRIIVASESVRNIFQFVGQLGVMKDEAVENVYMMRARHYDATHGRFISLDPLGAYYKATFTVCIYSPLCLSEHQCMIKCHIIYTCCLQQNYLTILRIYTYMFTSFLLLHDSSLQDFLQMFQTSMSMPATVLWW